MIEGVFSFDNPMPKEDQLKFISLYLKERCLLENKEYQPNLDQLETIHKHVNIECMVSAHLSL